MAPLTVEDRLLPAALRAAQAAGIQFTQRPILRFFAPQGRHVAPMGGG